MGSGSSGLYSGTHGSRGASSTASHARQMGSGVRRWAQREADRCAAESKRKRKAFNTACIAFDPETGKTYYGRNGGIALNGNPKNPILFGVDGKGGLLPSHSLNHLSIGNCAEVDAINSALNDGADIGRLHIYTINVDSRRFGTVKPACENCTAAFRGKIKRNYTGWHKESE